MSTSLNRQFYDMQFASNDYAPAHQASSHPYSHLVKKFVADNKLSCRKCLEVGCGRGAFQDQVIDYTGVDISDEVAKYFHKPFVRADATELPFDSDSFDAVWSITVLEHIPRPALALCEICRVVRPGGLVLMAAAWHTRPWFSEGYPVRSFRDLSWKGKMIKLSIPFRDFPLYRFSRILFRRGIRLIEYRLKPSPLPLRYSVLRPNYEKLWMSDSDACNSLDPFDVLLWFESRGHHCLSHPNTTSQILNRELGLVFRMNE